MIRGSVLIVEDESIIALDLEENLKDMGFDIAGVTDEETEALEIAKTNSPDVALMDINLNGVKDGIDIASELKEQYRIPTIFLTAHSDREIVDRAVGISPYGYLLKPYKYDELEIAIETVLKRSLMDKEVSIRMKLLKDAIENMLEGIIIVNNNGIISFANSQAKIILEKSEKEIIGRSVEEVLFIDEDQHDGHTKASHRKNRDIFFRSNPVMNNSTVLGNIFQISINEDFIDESEFFTEEVEESSSIQICSSCNHIKDGKNDWIDLDTYLEKSLKLEITKSLCKDCIKKYFPDQENLQALFLNKD